MLILSLSTVTFPSITIFDDDQISQSFVSNEKKAEFVNELLSQIVSLEKIDLFVIVVGPGSYTGVKIGIAVMNSLQLFYKKPVISITTFEAVACRERNITVGLRIGNHTHYQNFGSGGQILMLDDEMNLATNAGLLAFKDKLNTTKLDFAKPYYISQYN